MTLFLSWVPRDPWYLYNKVPFWCKPNKTTFPSLAPNQVLSSTEHFYGCIGSLGWKWWERKEGGGFNNKETRGYKYSCSYIPVPSPQRFSAARGKKHRRLLPEDALKCQFTQRLVNWSQNRCYAECNLTSLAILHLQKYVFARSASTSGFCVCSN